MKLESQLVRSIGWYLVEEVLGLGQERVALSLFNCASEWPE